MRRFISAFLVLVLMMAMAVPCFAAESDSQVSTYATKTISDGLGNQYKLNYYSGISGGSVSVYTIYERTTESATDTYSNLEYTVEAEGYVLLRWTLDPEETISATKTVIGSRTATAQKVQSFSAIVESVNGEHTFNVVTNKGEGDTIVNVMYLTADLNEDFYQKSRNNYS